jgi:NMD protein affecting ribosome stability and mRNA decay
MKSNTRSQLKARPTRRIAGRAQNDHMLDPYQARQKLQEPTVCPQCGAVYHHGRWQWGRSPEGARQDVCPACHRINDGLSAGIVTLHGPVARPRKQEIVGLARHEEAAERVEHPLNRIIRIEDTEDGLVISTTDIHLPRRIGTALKRAMHGTLDMHFDDAGYFVRVDWRPIG